MPMGVPFEATPEVLERIEHWAARGLTQEQIAHNMGIAPQTLSTNKGTKPEVREAIERGQAKGIATVTNALMDNAQGGNLGAQCFYLKNRDPEHWSDRQDIHHSGTVGFDVIDYTGDDPDDDEEDPEAA